MRVLHVTRLVLYAARHIWNFWPPDHGMILVVFLQWQETPNSPPHCSRLTGVPGALCSLLSALRGAASRGCNMRVAHHTIWDITAPGASTILRTEFHLFIVGQEALQFLAPAGLPRLLLLPGTPGAPLLQALLCPGHLSVP